MDKFQWEERSGYFLAGGSRVDSLDEARRRVLEDPEHLMGYTMNGPLVYVCAQGSLMHKVDGFTTHVLLCKSVEYDGPLWEDSHCGEKGAGHFAGGLENGKGDTAPWAEWKRPGRGEGLYDRPGVKLFAKIDPDDMHQGSVGDCSLIASIAALAEFPEGLRRLITFPNTALDKVNPVSPSGQYQVRLWDWGKLGWRDIELDDRFAMKPGQTQAAFAKMSEDGEIYPMLLEKAVAIIAGGYDYCNSIMPTWALGTLTGCPEVYEFHLEKGSWTGWRPAYDGTSTWREVSRSTGNAWPDGTDGSVPKECKEMWRAMQTWDDRDHLMCCGARAIGKSDKDNRNGVLYLHAYSVLQVKTNVAGSGQNLLQLRNPHGKGGQEPDLPWKDGHENWMRFPAVAEQLGWMEGMWKADGLFWICEKDFFEYFNTLYVVKCDTKRLSGCEAGDVCKMGCGRKVCAVKDGRRYKTCCRACALGRGHSKECDGGAGPLRISVVPGLPCKLGCGRTVAGGFDTCCRTCQRGCGGHGPRCDERAARVAAATVPHKARYQAGVHCQYLSAALGRWVDCRVVQCREDGAVQIDVKPGYWLSLVEQAQKLQIQRAPGPPPMPGFREGESLLYHSSTAGGWIECKVTRRRSEDAAVELNVKPGHWLSAAEQSKKLLRPA